MIDTLAKTELVDVDDQDFTDWADYFLTEKTDCYSGVIPFLREKIEQSEKFQTEKNTLVVGYNTFQRGGFFMFSVRLEKLAPRACGR